MLKIILLSVSFLFCLNCESKERIYFVTDLMPVDGQRKADLVSRFVNYMSDELVDKYEFRYQQASREREWRILTQRPNVCLYNKKRSVERSKVAYFSQSPLIVYPPNRLITRKALSNDDAVSLTELLKQKELTVGVVKGRQYGSEIDKLISAKTENLYVGAGTNKAERLHRMFTQGKLDAIVEYSSVFKSRQIVAKDKTEYFVYPLIEAKKAAKGYIACAKSKLGKQVIADFETMMQRPDYQAFAARSLRTESAIVEQEFMIEQLGY